MYIINIDDNKSLVISNAIKVDFIENNKFVVFYDKNKKVVALYKLDEIKGFHKTDSVFGKRKRPFEKGDKIKHHGLSVDFGGPVGKPIEKGGITMNNKELLDNAIKALESLRDRRLNYVRIDTSDNGDGELNLSIDVDFIDETDSEVNVLKAEGSA